MSSQPPVVGQLSPDGFWQWDGTQWVPAYGTGAPSAPRPKRSMAWLWWLAGGCLVLIVIGIAGAAIGIGSLLHSFSQGGFSCLPSDFPTYRGATVANEYTNIGTNVAPGDTHECTMTFDSNDDVATVTQFYVSSLASGDWKIDSNDPSTGEITFHRVSRPATVGKVDLLGRGQHTQIDVLLDS